MSKLIYNKTRSHGKNTNALSGAGVDTIKIKIPSGQKFTRLTLTMSSSHVGVATFNVISVPSLNATGNQEIKIMWTYGPFSKCSYKLKVYSDAVNAVGVKPTVLFGAQDWFNLAIGYIKQRKPFTLRVQGPDAEKLFSAINPIRTSLISRNIAINEVIVAMTVAICITVIAVSGLGVLGAVLLYAVNQGCTTKASYDFNGNLASGSAGQKMDFDFMNCGN